MGLLVRLSELYNSTQGEGPKVGLPTTFVRFGGCNLRCPAWPCDSPYAIDTKRYRSEWETVTPQALAERVSDKALEGANVCLTGGEPWLQNHGELRELIGTLYGGGRKVECFSNGTLEIPDWAFDRVTFVFDRKLRSSGENLGKLRAFSPLNDDPFETNLHRGFVDGVAVLKYTIASMDDIAEATADFYNLTNPYTSPEGIRNELQVYIGAVWGKVKESEIAEWLATSDLNNWHLNVQVHKYLWDPEAREI